MAEFCKRADLVQNDRQKFLHVAGTNGKGSTTAYLQSFLVECGFNTGAFFSPYVVDPRERIQHGRELIDKQDLASMTSELIPIAEAFTDTEFGGITEFEFKTALGFLFWKRKDCDWVALEVGLGGRLDATNVITAAASLIVSIGLDHMSILGNSIEEIAHEKAGIIKPSCPVVIGELPTEAEKVMICTAAELGAPLWLVGKEVTYEAMPDGFRVTTPVQQLSGLNPGLLGDKQPHNMALAIGGMNAAGIVLSEWNAQRGAKATSIPGRFQVLHARGRKWILDGAHNPDAALVLRHSLKHYLDPLERVVLVTNMISGHIPDSFYSVINGVADEAHVVPIGFHRALPPKETALSVQKTVQRCFAHDSLDEGLQAAIQNTTPDDTILVTGSFYLVGEVMSALSLLSEPLHP